MGTKRLYLDDPWLDRFTATVLALRSDAGRVLVELDQSAFYPESGGQMADRGTMAGRAVQDVQVGQDGVIVHQLAGDPPAVGEQVVCELDLARRREHMALHTGQHMLSQALLRVAGARTISARLGETDCTLDVGCPRVGAEQVAAAEALVHGVIDRDVVIRAYLPTQAELSTLPLRRTPKVEHDVRVVAIGDFDVTPCGGTHCTRSGQVALLQVLATERYKGATRVHFVAGVRARHVVGVQARTLQRLGRELSCGALDVPRAVAKLQAELQAARSSLAVAQADRARRIAAELAREPSSESFCAAALDAAPLELLREVAALLTKGTGRLVLLAGRGAESLVLLAQRGPQSRVHCGQLLAALCSLGGGRGGGRPEHGEGSVPATAPWPTLVEHARGLAGELAPSA